MYTVYNLSFLSDELINTVCIDDILGPITSSQAFPRTHATASHLRKTTSNAQNIKSALNDIDCHRCDIDVTSIVIDTTSI